MSINQEVLVNALSVGITAGVVSYIATTHAMKQTSEAIKNKIINYIPIQTISITNTAGDLIQIEQFAEDVCGTEKYYHHWSIVQKVVLISILVFSLALVAAHYLFN